MTDRKEIVWTDEELHQAYDVLLMVGDSGASAMRRALLFLAALPAAEARERERDAHRNGIRDSASHIEPGGGWTDHRYPSFTPPPPPPLVLSTGEWERVPVNKYWVCNNVSWNNPHVRTAPDADHLAAWLRQYGSDDEKR